MAHVLLENLRSKLLARLDSVSKKRGQFQDVNAFIEFRNASGVEKGEQVNLKNFKQALQQFDCSFNDDTSRQAFGILTRQDNRSKTDDVAITFNHFKEWCAVRDANKQRAERKAGGRLFSPTPRSDSFGRGTPRIGRSKAENIGPLTGRSLSTAHRQEMESQTTARSKRSNRSNRSSQQTSRSVQSKSSSRRPSFTTATSKLNNPMISVDGYDVSKIDLYEMLRKKIIGKHPGGSHGLLRCWKQFRQMSGCGRGGGGGRGAGVVTKEELGVCFRNYGLKLDHASDLDFIFHQFDRDNDGVISLDEWLEEIFGKWSTDVNTIGDDKNEAVYEGLVYKPMEYLDIPVQQVLDMLRAKILRRMKGGSSAARRAWNQFRTMSGGDPEGVNEEDLGQALRYYGMPVSDTIRKKVFECMDLQKNGLITFVEFWKTVLAEKGTCSFLDTLSFKTSGSKEMEEVLVEMEGEKNEMEDIGGGGEGKKMESSSRSRAGRPRGLDDDGAPDTSTYLDFVETMVSARSSSRSSRHSVLLPTPGSIHAAVQEKVRRIFVVVLFFSLLSVRVLWFLCFFVSLFLCFFVSLFLCFFVSMFLCFYVSMFLCFFVDQLFYSFFILFCSLFFYQMRQIPHKNWRGLQKAFRRADGSSRTAVLDLKTFSYILSEYGVSLTREELRYASDVSGGGTGRGQRGNGPTIVDFSTLATSSAIKPTRVVKYAEFLRKFVKSKVLLCGLKRK